MSGVTTAQELGSRLVGGTAGNAWPALVARLGRGVVPPYPGPDVVRVAVVPAPPRVEPTDTPHEQARMLAQAYAGALESRYGVRWWGMGRGALYGRPWYRGLVAAASVFVDKEIAPASWAAWSCDAWREFSQSSTPPTIAWVFSARRTTDLRWAFRRDVGVRDGGAVLLPPEHRDLVDRWHAMRMELLSAPPIDARAAAVVVRRHFPDGWDAHVALAARASENAEQAMAARVASGGFVW